MIVRSTRSVVCACLVALLFSALPATAQITTGTVLGNVKDSTGGVVPGATVVLISESRGTKSVPAVTNATGDYVFPNVTPDTYTVEVTMDGFRTVQRPGIKVSGGDRVTVPSLTLEPGGAEETVNVTSEAPLIQASSGERSFAVSTEQIENLPINHCGDFTELHVVHARRRRRRRVGRRHAPRRRRPEQHHDGRHLGHGHGQQRPDAQHERRVDRRGQGPDAGLPGGVRPVERPADHGRHQERHQPLPRRRPTTSRSTRTGTRTAGSTRRTATPSRSTSETSTATRSAVRSASPAATTSCSSSTRHEYRPTNAAINNGNPIRLRVPTALERAGDFSQTLDNNGALFNVIKRPQPISRASERRHQRAASRMAACSAGSRRTGSIRPASASCNRYPLPNVTQAAGTQLQLPGGRRRAVENLDAAAGHPPRLPAVVEAARHRQVLGRARARARRRPG